MPHVHTSMPSPLGTLKLVASDAGLAAVLWPDDSPTRVPLGVTTAGDGHPVLADAKRQLADYFAGRRTAFTVPLDFAGGTPFQRQVWHALLAIPFGQTRTYAQVATALGNPKAVRAVGAANGRNPISIVAPCHRVVGSTGSLTGFAGGLAAKRFLLDLEAQTARLF